MVAGVFVFSATSEAEAPTVTASSTTTASISTTTTISQAQLEAFYAKVQENAWYEAVAAQEAAKKAEAEKQRKAEAARRAQQQQQQQQDSPSVGGSGAPGGGNGLVSDGGKLCWGPCVRTQLPCAIPQYICNRESGGWANVKNRVSSASGKYQFLDSTWAGFGGYAHAGQAPESVQDQKAAQLWNGGRGCSHWSAC